MNLEETQRGIATVLKKIEGGKLWKNPVALSEELVRLSSYANYYAQHIIHKRKQFESERLTHYRKYRESGVSQNQSDIQAKYDTLIEREEAEGMELYYKSLRDHCSAIQTHLSTLKAFKDT